MGILDTINGFDNNFTSNDFLYRESLDKLLLEINDDFAKEINWQPLSIGGSSFLPNDLVLNQNGNYEFRTTFGQKLFPLFFIIPGFFSLFIGLKSFFISFEIKDFFNLIIPFAIIFIGFYFYKIITSPTVFDKQVGYFYKGKPKINYGIIDISDKNLIPLSSIYSIQIIKEKVHTKNSSYNSYEINLVLKDKKRINVVDHGNLEKIKEQSKILGEYLGVPVWDASIVF